MTESERQIIRDFAGGNEALRQEAIAVHRALLAECRGRNRSELPYGDPYFEFMREVDTPVPDYGLRAHYRAKIIGATPCP